MDILCLQAYEAAKIVRMKQQQEEVMRVDRACSMLLQQEARYRRAPGTESLSPLTRREAAVAVRQVVMGFGRMTALMQHDIDKAVELYNTLSQLDRDEEVYRQKAPSPDEHERSNVA